VVNSVWLGSGRAGLGSLFWRERGGLGPSPWPLPLLRWCLPVPVPVREFRHLFFHSLICGFCRRNIRSGRRFLLPQECELLSNLRSVLVTLGGFPARFLRFEVCPVNFFLSSCPSVATLHLLFPVEDSVSYNVLSGR